MPEISLRRPLELLVLIFDQDRVIMDGTTNASPVASDRFDSLAKTKFSLARHLNIHYRTKSSKC